MGSYEQPTLHAVAARAQVSIASVSRVINGLGATQKTQDRVQRAINELGYQPNFSARALKVKNSEQICLILPDLANPVFQSMIRGVQTGFRSTKYRIMLSTSAMTTTEIVNQLRSLGQNFADGLIINALMYDEEITELLRNLNIPIVVLGTTPKGIEADSIRVDNEKGVELGVDYLREKGRRRVLLLNGPQHTVPAKLRRTGFVNALKKYGIQDAERHVISSKSFTAKAAIQSLNDFNGISKYDAVICANDLLAAGALRYFSENRINVPDEIAIVGIDNTDLAELLNPAITSVDFKAEYRGEMAATYLRERLANPDLPRRRLLIDPELVVRDSA